MSRKYHLGAERHAHFVTFTVLDWIDFFTRKEYSEIFIQSIAYCQEHKGLEVFGASCQVTSILSSEQRIKKGWRLSSGI